MIKYDAEYLLCDLNLKEKNKTKMKQREKHKQNRNFILCSKVFSSKATTTTITLMKNRKTDSVEDNSWLSQFIPNSSIK